MSYEWHEEAQAAEFDGSGRDEVSADSQEAKSAYDLSPHELGAHGEDVAAQFLKDAGYEILERNFTCQFGEADIIAEDDGVVVLCEVKTRAVRGSLEESWPELAVDQEKMDRYRRIGLVYYAMHPEMDEMRFDVIAINVVDGHTAKIRHITTAFEMYC